MNPFKSFAARLPSGWQAEIRRLRYARQIRRGSFSTDEPEYARLGEWVRPGDWALDVGANVGHYAKRLSELVGPKGRVVAFEPTPATFAMLAANAQLFAHPNVTLINAAASDKPDLVGMLVPQFDSGLPNYYEAQLAPAETAPVAVLALPIDSIAFPRRISFVKIDAEDHEAQVLAGMQSLLAKHRPVLVVETGSRDVSSHLQSLGYSAEKLPGSPNLLFIPRPSG